MSTKNKTKNLKLPQYQNDDLFDMKEVNEAYKIIDESYKEQNDNYKQAIETSTINGAIDNLELIDARKGKRTLGEKISEIDEELSEIDSQLDNKASKNQCFVEDFGAKGDGVTDDFQAIYNAITSDNTVIEFKQGKTYYFTKVELFNNINNKIIKGNGAILKYKGEETTNQANGGVLYFKACDNIKIDNLVVNVNGVWFQRPYNYETDFSNYESKRNKFKDAFFFENCTNINVFQCEANNCRVGFYFMGCKNAKLNMSKSYQTMADSYFITGACNMVNVSNHTSEKCNDDTNTICGFNADMNLNPMNCIASNNIALDCFGSNATMQGATNCKIINCTSKNNRDVPFKLGSENPAKNKCVNCTIDNVTVETTNIIQGEYEESTSLHCKTFLGTTNSNNIISNCKFIRNNTSQPNMENIITTNDVKILNCYIEGYEFIFSSSNNIELNNNKITINGALCVNQSSNIKFVNNKIKSKETYTSRGTTVLSLNNTNQCELNSNEYVYSTFKPVSFYNDDNNGNHFLSEKVPILFSGTLNNYSNGIITVGADYGYSTFKEGQLVFYTTTNNLKIRKGNTMIVIS